MDKKQPAKSKPFFSFLLKCTSVLPAVFMMCVIFGFSAQTGDVSGDLSYKISYQIVQTGSRILHQTMDEEQLDEQAQKLEYPLRKCAHMTEYFLLALTTVLPLYVWGVRGNRLCFTAFFLCVLFACGDEFHQSFVSDRSPAVRDVLIDSIGSALSLLAVRLFTALRNRRRRG